MRRFGIIVFVAMPLLVACGLSPRRAELKLSGTTKAPRLLASGSSCRPVHEKRLWTVLFGAVALSEWSLPEAERGTAYRIRERMEWSDILITVFGGWAVSLSTRTLVVEKCKSEFQITSRAIEEAERKRALSDWARGQDVRILTHDGGIFRGRLLSVEQDVWQLSYLPSLDSGQDHLYLKDGTVLSGKVLHHAGGTVRFKTEAGIRKFSTKELQKILFAGGPISPVHFQIPTKDIRRVFFRPNTAEDSQDGKDGRKSDKPLRRTKG